MSGGRGCALPAAGAGSRAGEESGRVGISCRDISSGYLGIHGPESVGVSQAPPGLPPAATETLPVGSGLVSCSAGRGSRGAARNEPFGGCSHPVFFPCEIPREQQERPRYSRHPHEAVPHPGRSGIHPPFPGCGQSPSPPSTGKAEDARRGTRCFPSSLSYPALPGAPE